MAKKQHYMTEQERYTLEGMLRAKRPVAWIAKELGFSRQTIYNEIRRGTYLHTIGGYRDVPRYSAQKGQAVQSRNQQNKGRDLKIGHDLAYADYLERKIIQNKYSPAAALASARAEGFQTKICVNTLYHYIDLGIFRILTNGHLLEKLTRRPRKKDTGPKVAHPSLPSIEDRPERIGRRQEKGHWEMDLIVGPEGSSAALLTLTERVTREEMIFKLPNKRAASVRRIFNRLERTAPDFRQRFKSISTDNGPEFMEYDKLIRSIHGGKRFDVWYCHSYAAWEKGTNENHNRMIRRFFPKGTDFKKITEKQIAALQDWMNGYPRKILGWRSPRELAA